MFINRQLIYNYPEQLLLDAGVSSIEHADFEGIERLALALDCEIVSTFDHPDLVKIGSCERIEEILIGEDRLVRFAGVPKGEACSIVLRGASKHILDEAERSLHDALCVLSQTVNNPQVVYGGGCTEMLMSNAVDQLAKETLGKESLAVEAFSRALRKIPFILAENAGYDSIDLVSALRAAHHKGDSYAGLNMYTGEVADMRELGIMESWKAKNHVVAAAFEAAEMILRIDEIVRCAPRKRDPGHH